MGQQESQLKVSPQSPNSARVAHVLQQRLLQHRLDCGQPDRSGEATRPQQGVPAEVAPHDVQPASANLRGALACDQQFFKARSRCAPWYRYCLEHAPELALVP